MNYFNEIKNKIDNVKIDKDIDCLRTICINVTDYCNLKCEYCPHSKGFKNIKENTMDVYTAEQLARRLKEINYKNRITISGFGEPMTMSRLSDILYELRDFNISIITNGLIVPEDKDKILKFSNNIIVSLHNINYLEVVKDNWPTAIIRNHDINDKNCELNITNRAGFLNDEINDNICTCPFYKMMIDYDGSYLLCSDDFNRKSKNVNLNIFNMSIDKYFNEHIKYIKDRIQISRKILTPCNHCNINGTMYGMNIVNQYNCLHEKRDKNERL